MSQQRLLSPEPGDSLPVAMADCFGDCDLGLAFACQSQGKAKVQVQVCNNGQLRALTCCAPTLVSRLFRAGLSGATEMVAGKDRLLLIRDGLAGKVTMGLAEPKEAEPKEADLCLLFSLCHSCRR